MDRKFLGALVFFFLVITNFQAFAQVKLKECLYSPEDKRIAEKKLNAFSGKSDLPVGDLLTQIGFSFLGTPYAAATLENGAEEKLVINLRQLDCTTFVENCLALARTVKQKKTDFDAFATELEHIRYRNGRRNGYPSRLHYFSDWIHNNANKKIISEEPNFEGVKLSKTINFMSTHPQDYPVLKDHPELLPEIALQEKKLSTVPFYYFPKENPANLLKALHPGDIIGLTSSIDGIDINHVGIIILKNNQFHLLHASLSNKKVLISEGPITDFLAPKSKNTGIMIARPVF